MVYFFCYRRKRQHRALQGSNPAFSGYNQTGKERYPLMKTDRNGRNGLTRRAACFLTALLALCIAFGAFAEADDRFQHEPDLILAQDAAERMELKGHDGQPMTVRRDTSLPSRGEATEDGAEPQYIGVIGFAALAKDPELSKFSVFDKAYWTIPVFQKNGEEYVLDGTIAHKMPVVVTGQELTPAEDGSYDGFLEIVRLDTGDPCYIEAKCFVTVPYWTLPIREMADYGYSIAVYRETRGEGPKDENGSAVFLRDGTRVLIPFRGACPDNNPEPENLQIQGVVFREDGEGTITCRTVYFRESDLVPNY